MVHIFKSLFQAFIWAFYQIFNKVGRGLTGSQFLEGVCWERRGWLFQGSCSFYVKNKLKSEIFYDKRSLYTKNLNWEILTKNLVTFKKWDGVKD